MIGVEKEARRKRDDRRDLVGRVDWCRNDGAEPVQPRADIAYCQYVKIPAERLTSVRYGRDNETRPILPTSASLSSASRISLEVGHVTDHPFPSPSDRR